MTLKYHNYATFQKILNEHFGGSMPIYMPHMKLLHQWWSQNYCIQTIMLMQDNTIPQPDYISELATSKINYKLPSQKILNQRTADTTRRTIFTWNQRILTITMKIWPNMKYNEHLKYRDEIPINASYNWHSYMYTRLYPQNVEWYISTLWPTCFYMHGELSHLKHGDCYLAVFKY